MPMATMLSSHSRSRHRHQLRALGHRAISLIDSIIRITPVTLFTAVFYLKRSNASSRNGWMSEPSTTIIPSTPQPTKSAWFGYAAAELRTVTVADPYLEMHTGPGRGYPVFHVVDRGESVDVVMQRTDWYLVRTGNGKEGWVDREQMELTLRPDGQQVSFERASIEDFTNARWETG